MNTSPLRRDERACYISPLHEYACTLLNPVHARDPLDESYPTTRRRITTRPLHKIETCLPLLSAGYNCFIPLIIVRALLNWKKAIHFNIKKPNSNRKIQGCFPAVARNPWILVSTWVVSLNHRESEISEGRERCRSF